MNLQSPGYKSQFIFTGFDGKVEDRGSYLVVRTLSNPNFFWGNLLIFDRPPWRSDFSEWTELFKREFTDPQIYHITLAWDSVNSEIGDPSSFVENGYSLEANAVLSTTDVTKPPKFNESLVVGPIQSEEEWERMIEVQVSSAHDNLPRSEWEQFYRTQKLRYQGMEQAGLGHWFGGYLDENLVTGLGIFHRDGIGRFQTVCTDPEFQRQGLCGTLLFKSSRYAFQNMGLRKLIMCADPDYHAIKIYESVGFKQELIEHGVYWWDRNHKS